MQWGNVLGLSTNPTVSNQVTIVGVTNQWIHQIWQNTNGSTQLEAWADIGGDHGPSDALFKVKETARKKLESGSKLSFDELKLLYSEKD